MINTDWASPLGSLPLPQPTLGGLPQQQGGSYGALPMPMAGALPQGQPMPPMAAAPPQNDTSPSQFAQADFMPNRPQPANPPMPMARAQAFQQAQAAPAPFGSPAALATVAPQAAAAAPDTTGTTPATNGSGTGVSGFLDRLRANSKAANYQMIRPDSLFGHLGNIFSNDPIQKGAGPLSIFAKSLFGG